MRLVFIGTGYVGLVSGTCFAELGYAVTCVDIDADKIAALQNGQIPIYEPQLEDLVQRNVAAGRLQFATDVAGSVTDADLVFLAVGTPCLPGSDAVDLSYIFAGAEMVAPHLRSDALLVVKSTVPPGTCRKLSTLGCNVVSNPEFLREGAAVQDFMHPDRVVIGCEDAQAAAKMQQLYAGLNAPIVTTTLETAELIKYSANAFLAMKVAYINEIADVCEKIGADAQQVAYGIGLDRRIGQHFLQPGPGFGGSCFPKDIRGLNEFAQTVMAPSKLVSAVIDANNARFANCVQKIKELCCGCCGSVKDKTIAVLGLAFKANTDDIRESPAIKICELLLAEGAIVKAYDPAAMENAAKHFAGNSNIQFCASIEECLQDAATTVIATEWQEFKNLDPILIKNVMTKPLIIDFRNLYAQDAFTKHAIQYESVGRASA